MIELLVSWLLFPLVFAFAAIGTGLLLERLVSWRMPLALLGPAGLCLQIALVYPLYKLGADATVVTPVALAVAVAGWVVGGRSLPPRFSLSPGFVAVAAIFLLYLGPVLLSGSATFGGYNFVNDTAVQLLLADHLALEGGQTPPELGDTTRSQNLVANLRNAYPLGAHSQLATFRFLPGVELHHLYQPYLALLMAMAGAALFQLFRRSGLGDWPAAIAAPIALAANLIFSYAMHGAVKEVVALASLILAAAFAREILASVRPVATAICVGLAGATALLSLNMAALPFLGGIAVLLAGVVLIKGPRTLRRRLPLIAMAGLATCLALAAPILIGAETFVRGATQGALSNQQDFGHLAEPLRIAQTAGIWLSGDYRLLPPDHLELTYALVGVAFLLATLGIGWLVRRGEWGPLFLFGSGLLAWIALSPQASPYSDAKLLMLASPFVMTLAVFGVAALWGYRRRLEAALAAAVVAGGVLASDAFTHHDINLAPLERFESLQEAAGKFSGEPGPILLNEPEAYAKYLVREAKLVMPYEAVTPAWAEPRAGAGGALGARGKFEANYFNLDDLEPGFVQRFPLLMLRRSPAESRPPANYDLVYRNAHYEVWRKNERPRILEHAGRAAVDSASSRLDCRELQEMSRKSGRLVAALAPKAQVLRLAGRSLPYGWPPYPAHPHVVDPGRPASAVWSLRSEGGLHDVWLRGSFGRPIEIRVDDRKVGEAQGLDNLGQYSYIGRVKLKPGRHRIVLRRGAGSLAPGNAARGEEIGALILQDAQQKSRLVTVTRRNARSVCKRPVDWVERLAGG